ncbi:MAG: addiction module protein [Planctomycetaceae bacterium]|nr:addiction module protein [Planctomycetaceae bacterium]
MNYQEVLNAAMTLPYSERLNLVEALDETLHPPPKYTEEELEEVLEQRMANFKAGRAKLVDADEAIRNIRAAVERADQSNNPEG